MDKQNRNILAGIVVIVVILVAFNMSQDDLQQTNSLVVETPENVGTVDGTTVNCPVGYTVISTVGGTPDQPQQPQCKAPYPSVEVFDCGDTIVDVNGKTHSVECFTP